MHDRVRRRGEAEQLAGHDDPLHLLGALADVEDLHVAVQLLEHAVVAHAGLAEDVEGGDDGVEDDRRRVHLGVARLQHVRLAVLGQPHRVEVHQPGHVQAAADAGQPLERPLPAPALRRVVVAHEVEGEVVGGPAHPDAVGGVQRPGHVERRHRRLEARARLVERLATEQVVRRQADVVEGEARRLVAARAHLVLDLQDLEAGRAALDDERPVPARGRAPGRPWPTRPPTRPAPSWSRTSSAHVSTHSSPVLAGPGLDAGHVAAGARLGHGHRPPAGHRVVGEDLRGTARAARGWPCCAAPGHRARDRAATAATPRSQ